MPIIPVQNPAAIDFKKNVRTPRPLPPAGNLYDGRMGENGSALFRAKQQVTTITLGGSTATGNVTTLTILPLKSAQGSQWADDVGQISLEFTTGATETLAAVAAGLDAAADSAQTISSLADLANFQRVNDFVLVSSDGDDIILTSRDPGATFSYSLSSTGSVTESGVTTGNEDDDLKIGLVAVRDGVDSKGVPRAEHPSASSVPSDILGVVMDGDDAAPVEAGALFKHYARGTDAKFRRFGTCTVYGEAACAADASVYVRKTASATEYAGAVNDAATTDVVEIQTVTPTPANTTLYRAEIEILDYFTGAKVAEGIIEMTSDADATATEICDGLRTSLADDNDQLDSYIVGSGTDTLVLTLAAGYVATVSPTGPGVLGVAETQAADSDHMLWAGAKFLETTTQAGPQAIAIAHP